MKPRALLLGLTIACIAWTAAAHEVRPAALTLEEVSQDQYIVRWKVPAMGDRRIAIDPVFTNACTDAAPATDASASGAAIRSWLMACPDGLAGTEIRFANLSATMIDVFVQVSFLDGRSYTGLVRPADPIYRVPVRDGQTAVFANFLRFGIEHILLGWDHLLFVLGLLLVVTGARRLMWAITGFTLAHSLTLALAALDVVRVPGPPVEALIALSILMLAVEGVRFQRTGHETLMTRAPWLVSLSMGLVHGLGFAGALSEYGIPAHAKLASLVSFNLGVEAGQIAFVALVLPIGFAAQRLGSNRLVSVRVAATWFVGTCGAFWLVQRVVGFYG